MTPNIEIDKQAEQDKEIIKRILEVVDGVRSGYIKLDELTEYSDKIVIKYTARVQ